MVSTAAAIVGAAVLLLVSFFRVPVAERLAVVPDDAFYYMVPAVNIARGLGPTADTITLTSAYHPLWMALLAVESWLVRFDKTALFAAVAITGMALHVAGALLLYLVGTRFAPRPVAFALSVAYGVRERALWEAVDGMEAALVTFVVIAFAALQTLPASPAWRRRAGSVVLGLVVLARTELALFALLWLAAVAVMTWRAEHRVGPVIRQVAVWIVGVALTVLPWIIVSRLLYGGFVQQSQLMKEFWRARLLAAGGPDAPLRVITEVLGTWIRVNYQLYPVLPLLLAFLVGIIVYRRLGDRWPAAAAPGDDAGRDALVMVAATLGLHLAAAGLFYAVRFTFVRDWYFASGRVFWPLAALALWTLAWPPGAPTAAALRRLRAATAVVLVVLALGLLGVALVRTAHGGPLRDHTGVLCAGRLAVAEWVRAHTPPDAILAAYSSGTLAYFAERRVVNLDGLANNDVLRVVQSRAMDRYLDRLGVTYVADHESIVRPDFVVAGLLHDGDPAYVDRLQEVYRVPCRSRYGDVVVWRVRPRER